MENHTKAEYRSSFLSQHYVTLSVRSRVYIRVELNPQMEIHPEYRVWGVCDLLPLEGSLQRISYRLITLPHL